MTTNFIIISQSELVDHAQLSKLPLDRLSEYQHLVYPRMVRYQDGFYAHTDLLNKLGTGNFLHEVPSIQRKHLLSVWNLPGFAGIHLASYLWKFNIHTSVINNWDAEWDRFEQILSENSKPPLVGISCTFHLNFSESVRIIKKIRATYPDVPIVLGGAFINERMRSVGADRIGQFMCKYSVEFALHAVNSEVDLRDLIVWYQSGQKGQPESVHNLLYLQGPKENRSYCSNPHRWHPPVLTDHSQHLKSLDLPFVHHTLPMRTSAGCSFSCAFCSYPDVAQGFHLMPVEVVEAQLKSILHHSKVKRIIFIDDTPNVPKPRWNELCRMFAKYDFEWFSFLRVQYVDEPLARLMRDSGCRGVYLGIESANDTVLKNMNKKVTRKRFSQGIGFLKKYGITTLGAFVLGFPGETDATIQDNASFIAETELDFYSLKEFFYMKNTPIHEQRASYGLSGEGSVWKHNSMDSESAYQHKITLFREIKSSVFVDPDTSLWYLAYLYDQGFSLSDVATLQKEINAIMSSQMAGDIKDQHPGFERISTMLRTRNEPSAMVKIT